MSIQNQLYTREVNLRNTAGSQTIKVGANPTASYSITLPPVITHNGVVAPVIGQFLDTIDTSGTLQWTDKLNAGIGLATAPSISFQAEPTTGLFKESGNEGKLATASLGVKVVEASRGATDIATSYLSSLGTTAATDASGNTGALRTKGGLSVAGKGYVASDFSVGGNLIVAGTTTSVDSTNVNIKDANIYIGADNTTVTPVSGGISVNVGAVATGVAATTLFTGIAVSATGAAGVVAGGEFIQVSGSANNDGVYEVLSINADVITINGSPTYKFCNTGFTASSPSDAIAGVVTRVNISQIFTSGGKWQVSQGATVAASTTNLADIATVGTSTVTTEQKSVNFPVTKGITDINGGATIIGTLPAASVSVGKTFMVYLSVAANVTINTAGGADRIGDGAATSVVLNSQYQYARLTCVSTAQWILG
jgi:hypothetical protein